MFTGIITHLGKIVEKSDTRLVIEPQKGLLEKFEKGLSVAIDGICLTVVAFDDQTFSIDFMPETAKKTNIEQLKIGSMVNLELPATGATFLSGHVVQGHVDGVGTIESIAKEGNSYLFVFHLPQNLTKYIVEKGSISVNGISLTVIDSTEDAFSVGIIPHTWDHTMLHTAKEGDKINIEVDVLAKYIEKLLRKNP
ncbi:MAG: riboflavin synthase [Candidatus Levybacteria bacterium]|nr:riboflavin synthase [Candidatus Levybacteria bacterium]